MKNVYRVDRSVRTVIEKDGGILLNVETGLCYGLNAMGARIWRDLSRGNAEDTVVELIAKETNTSDDHVRTACATFITALIQKGLLRDASDAH